MDWIISRQPFRRSVFSSDSCGFCCYLGESHQFENGKIVIAISGYVIPRTKWYSEYSHLKDYDLIYSLYKIFSHEFIHRIKGIFNIIIIDDGEIKIFNDTHGLKKFFFWSSGENFIVSNHISDIASYSESAYDYENMALFCLMEHFAGGNTIYRNVYQSEPASCIKIRNRLEKSEYWNPAMLFGKGEEIKTISAFSEPWKKIIENHIDYFKISSVSLTLTGGTDSRLVLAALKKTKADINAFAYGHPDSFDCVIAREISERLGINCNNYPFSETSKEWFKECSDEIIDIGESLINIHRIHRHQAAILERKNNPDTEMIFTGLMGGEYLKGISYDNYIIPEFLRRMPERNEDEVILFLKEQLIQKGLILASLDLKKLAETLLEFDFIWMQNRKHREFLYAFYLYGCSHHIQDSLIYMNSFKYLVNPFMDIDFLEMLAGSPFISYKRRIFPDKLIFPASFQVLLTNKLLPEISDIQYNKNGFYTANDLSGSGLGYLIKRVTGFFNKSERPANFEYKESFRDYCKEEYENLNSHIRYLFDCKAMASGLQNVKSLRTEGNWHFYTNPLNLNYNSKK